MARRRKNEMDTLLASGTFLYIDDESLRLFVSDFLLVMFDDDEYF